MCAEKNYWVCVEKETRTHLVLRCGPDFDDSVSVFGPDTFSACIQWVNTRNQKSEKLAACGYKVFRNKITETCFISGNSTEPADSVEVHGPTGFAACLEWMRFHATPSYTGGTSHPEHVEALENGYRVFNLVWLR
jgi:hypothetical protein